MKNEEPVLVTGAAGHVGSVGRMVTERLLARRQPVRAFVRREDERAQHLRALGADVFVGDLLSPADVRAAVQGCKRVYFSMSLNQYYVDVAVLLASVAKRQADFQLFVSMSEYEQEYMTLEAAASSAEVRSQRFGADITWSPQQRAHWATEQALNWSGLPVAHVRAAMFVENPILFWIPTPGIRQRNHLSVPFGEGQTAPVAATDVADVIVELLARPAGRAGTTYALTGPERKSMREFAEDFSAALGRSISYAPQPLDEWKQALSSVIHDPHIREHLTNLALQNASGAYIRAVTSDVETLLGRSATTLREVVAQHASRFGPEKP